MVHSKFDVNFFPRFAHATTCLWKHQVKTKTWLGLNTQNICLFLLGKCRVTVQTFSCVAPCLFWNRTCGEMLCKQLHVCNDSRSFLAWHHFLHSQHPVWFPEKTKSPCQCQCNFVWTEFIWIFSWFLQVTNHGGSCIRCRTRWVQSRVLPTVDTGMKRQIECVVFCWGWSENNWVQFIKRHAERTFFVFLFGTLLGLTVSVHFRFQMVNFQNFCVWHSHWPRGCAVSLNECRIYGHNLW